MKSNFLHCEKDQTKNSSPFWCKWPFYHQKKLLKAANSTSKGSSSNLLQMVLLTKVWWKSGNYTEIRKPSEAYSHPFADVFRNRCSWKFCNIHKKNPVLECLFKKLASGLQLYWKETPTQMFSWQCCEVFKHRYFEEHLWTAASESFSFYVNLKVFRHEQVT